MRRLDPRQDLLRVTHVRMCSVCRAIGQRSSRKPQHRANQKQTVRHRRRLPVAIHVQLARLHESAEISFDLGVGVYWEGTLRISYSEKSSVLTPFSRPHLICAIL